MPLYTQAFVIGLWPRQNLDLMLIYYIAISPFLPMHEHWLCEKYKYFPVKP